MTNQVLDSGLLDRVFGESESGTPKERARQSKRLFVRGLDELTFDESPKAKGRRLTAVEALDAYGFDTLAEVATEGSALLCESVDAVGRALRERREQLALQIRTIASETGLTPEVIAALEASKRRPVREYEKVARALGLDERMLSFRSAPEGNQDVAVRLREMHDARPVLTSTVVISLAEASWVAMTQLRLEAELALPAPKHRFEVDAFYGSSQHPAYRVGYDLADSFREALKLGTEPIKSMRDLLENDLRIPLIQADLGTRIAGATVESAGRRAIVVNLFGRNQNPFVRRSTLAHELCHLLFDPQQKLRSLRVDEYAELDERADQRVDLVEQRANAFSVQLLAPQSSALRVYEATAHDQLAHVMDSFGLSFTAARYQVWNALKRAVPLDSIQADKSRPEPDWEGREGYTTTYHPIRALADHPSRAGRFSAVVLRAAEEGVVSWDSAGEWLFCSEQDIRRAAPSLRELYPDLFETKAKEGTGRNVLGHTVLPREGKKALSEVVSVQAKRSTETLNTELADAQAKSRAEADAQAEMLRWKRRRRRKALKLGGDRSQAKMTETTEPKSKGFNTPTTKPR
jgi:Zn-dependent peptidase ImmA (M78 family)